MTQVLKELLLEYAVCAPAESAVLIKSKQPD
jgi:hypothetical protein